MSGEIATTPNAMFAGLKWLAEHEGFILAIVGDIGGEPVMAYELCGPGILVVRDDNDCWQLKMTSVKEVYPCDPETFCLTAKFFNHPLSTEGALLTVAMLLACLNHWGNSTGMLDTARKNNHMFGGF